MIQGIYDGMLSTIFHLFVVFVLIILPLVTFGPYFEAKYFPVITNVHLTSVDTQEKYTSEYDLSFKKLRNCTLVTSNSQEKQQDIWIIQDLKNSKYTSHRVTISWYCHPLWLTTQEITIPNES